MKTAISLTITGLILVVIGMWPFAIPVLVIAIIKFKQKPQTEKHDICEFDIYKQAADIEKHLKESC